MKSQFFKTILTQTFMFAIVTVFFACSDDGGEDVFTLAGWKNTPVFWCSETATGTVAFGTSDTEVAYAQFVNKRLAAQPATVKGDILLEFFNDGKVFLSGDAKRYGVGEYELNGKTLLESNTLTLIGFSENQERINLGFRFKKDGLEIDMTNWKDIGEVMAKIIARKYIVEFSDEFGYASFNSHNEYITWVNNLKPTTANLIITFDAIQSR